MKRHTPSLYIITLFLCNQIICNEITTPQLTDHTPLTVTPNRKIDIQNVMNYEMPHIIARYCKDYNVSLEQAKLYEVELKRYLILAADDDEAVGMMSKEVDDLWHTFLLFTKDYQAFCNDMFGTFIHHVPL
jgi:hypothetical protein